MPTRPGKKILISGGGRCNFTNLHAAPDRFLSANPHFGKSALARYTPQDFIALVEQHRHRLAREDAGPAVLRRLGAADRRTCCWTNAPRGGVRMSLGERDRRRRRMPTGVSRVRYGDGDVDGAARW